MKYIKYPSVKDWSAILARPTFDNSQLLETVKAVLNDVRLRGDEAVKAWEQYFRSSQDAWFGDEGEE